jgi:hypothetical protein
MEDEERRPIEELLHPAIAARVARWEQRLVRELPPAPTTVRPELPVHVEPEAWPMALRGDPRERFIGGQLVQDLRHNTPQALLRDLHRPDLSLPERKLVPGESARDYAGLRGYAEARAAQQYERHKTLELSLTAVTLVRRERARWLREPWQPFYRDDEPHPVLSVPIWGAY